jgi:CDP-diacylglycerol--serine O-phosphatidyltransferase
MSAEHYETGDVPPAKSPARGIYWLPNVFTTGTLFGGFYAIVAAINGNFSRAGIAIFVAMLFDGLDGRVARWTNTQSDFGKEYDSLCDMVAFGVAPAIVAYQWGIERIADYGKFWTRFGWLASEFDLTGLPALALAFGITICIGALMVSRFSYWSGKELNVRGKIPWVYMALIPLVYVIVSLAPESLFALFGAYALSAPLFWLWRKIFKKKRLADSG